MTSTAERNLDTLRGAVRGAVLTDGDPDYDLARSVIYTRQGNPAWAGQERDGSHRFGPTICSSAPGPAT